MMKGMVFAERYKLEDFIGQGGMSLVYRAVDIRTGHSVAVKILKSEYNSDKEFLERFQREAQAASLMSHHNLVNLLDVGVEGEYRYLVLEYVNGNTLKDIIRQKGRLKLSDRRSRSPSAFSQPFSMRMTTASFTEISSPRMCSSTLTAM